MPRDLSPLPPDSLSAVCVLVVAEASHARGALHAILASQGALVLTAVSMTEALWLLGWVRPTIIVVDVPAMSGSVRGLVPLLRALKPEAGAVTPAVAVAESGADEGAMRASGFDAVVVRPLDPWGLCRLVFTLTSGAR
jgi:CheY-like chemotaxis protein